MTADDLRQLPADQASQLAPLLYALWQDAQGDWSAAHELAQVVETREGAWVHAYLHRKEGETSNAAYWYRQAGMPAVTKSGAGSLQAEWESIVTALLS